MRYLIINYYRKPNGKLDEATTVSKKVKMRDWQSAAVILDFKECKVLKATLDGQSVPKDFDRIVAFYHQHYPNIIERLFNENGYEIKVEKPGSTDPN
jgi:hypothetical protein